MRNPSRLGWLFLVVVALSAPGAVASTDVSTFDELSDCVATATDDTAPSCTLTADIEFTDSIYISFDVTIYGDGHQVTLPATAAYDSLLYKQHPTLSNPSASTIASTPS